MFFIAFGEDNLYKNTRGLLKKQVRKTQTLPIE